MKPGGGGCSSLFLCEDLNTTSIQVQSLKLQWKMYFLPSLKSIAHLLTLVAILLNKDPPRHPQNYEFLIIISLVTKIRYTS